MIGTMAITVLLGQPFDFALSDLRVARPVAALSAAFWYLYHVGVWVLAGFGATAPPSRPGIAAVAMCCLAVFGVGEIAARTYEAARKDLMDLLCRG